MKPHAIDLLLAPFLILFGCCAALAHAQDAKKPALLVFAAASLTNVLGEISPAWEKTSGIPVKLSFAASSVLARQIEAGGNADVFISADQEWMDYLQSRNLIDKTARRDLVGNRLVLIAPADSKLELKIATGFALAEALGDGRLATGDPDTVPAGRYARAALTSLGVWDEVADRLVRADNVRSAMMFVVARRSAARHRVCHGRRSSIRRSASSTFPGLDARADHLPRRRRPRRETPRRQPSSPILVANKRARHGGSSALWSYRGETLPGPCESPRPRSCWPPPALLGASTMPR